MTAPGFQCLAHIGMHKTASTWFRTQFYPRVLNARLVPREALREALFLPHALRFDPEVARGSLGLDRAGRVIMCDEGFCGYPDTGGHRGALQFDRLRRLRAVCPDARVVLLVRRQEDALLSLYGQYVRSGGSYGLRTWLFGGERRDVVPRFCLEQLDYDALAGHCAALFGDRRVLVYLYEAFRDNLPTFLARLATEHELDVDTTHVAADPVNTGYTVPALLAARSLNTFSRGIPDFKFFFAHVPGARQVSGGLARGLSRLTATWRPRLPTDVRERVVSALAPSNRALAARWGLDLARFGYALG